jgi:AsmA-like C-terminal region
LMSTTGWGTRNRRLILRVGIGIIATWYGLLLAAYFILPTLKSAIRDRTVEFLRSEFASDVHFQSFTVSLLPPVHVVARGVLIGTAANPLIQATTADAQSGFLPWRVKTLVLGGLSLHIPTIGSAPVVFPKPAWSPTVDQILSEHTDVEILPSTGTQPLHVELAHLRVANFTPDRAAEFTASLVSSEPRVEAPTSGRVGPWKASDPGSTPLQGTYRMPRFDLATVPGLKGLLSSKGRFQGALERLEITGTADAPEFSLNLSGRSQPLHASFQTVVDASDGSATIEHMNGSLQNSPFFGSGLVRKIQNDRLRDIVVDLSMNRGRLEDVLLLAVKSKISPVAGGLDVQANLEILPGEQDILNRLRLDSDFTAPNARFSSLDLRERLRNISRKPQGRHNNESVGGSLSNMQGHLRLTNGAAEFWNLAFDLEGASAQLNGSYQVASEQLDLHGELAMNAKLSQTSGVRKGFLLKVVDPFSRGKDGGPRVPIRITGTRSDPQFSLDRGR